MCTDTLVSADNRSRKCKRTRNLRTIPATTARLTRKFILLRFHRCNSRVYVHILYHKHAHGYLFKRYSRNGFFDSKTRIITSPDIRGLLTLRVNQRSIVAKKYK